MTERRPEALCRACGTPLKVPFADLGATPIANDMIAPHRLHHPESVYPLNAMVCDCCWLVQLDYNHAPDKLFTDEYPYFSSFSSTWLRHAERYAEAMRERFRLDGGSLVVEVASNDGYLLNFFQSAGVAVLGVEPCANVAEAAREKHGIRTVSEFFGRALGARLAAEFGKANLMTANNVLAHVPDIIDFLSGFAELLAEDGVATFEFPHLLELIKHNQFDTIYHEHYSYLSILSVSYSLAKVGLRIFDVERLPTHGGSLRLFVCHTGADHQETEALRALRAEEREAGLDGRAIYEAFAERVRRTKRALLSFLIDAKERGKTIVGYGAPAKGNTLLNYCGIGSDFLDYTVDISPHKQGWYLPGSRLPVFAPSKIAETRPDYLLILPWNIAAEVMEQNRQVRDWGGQFVLPIPDVKVV